MSDTHHKSEIAAHGDGLTGGDGDGPCWEADQRGTIICSKWLA